MHLVPRCPIFSPNSSSHRDVLWLICRARLRTSNRKRVVLSKFGKPWISSPSTLIGVHSISWLQPCSQGGPGEEKPERITSRAFRMRPIQQPRSLFESLLEERAGRTTRVTRERERATNPWSVNLQSCPYILTNFQNNVLVGQKTHMFCLRLNVLNASLALALSLLKYATVRSRTRICAERNRRRRWHGVTRDKECRRRSERDGQEEERKAGLRVIHATSHGFYWFKTLNSNYSSNNLLLYSKKISCLSQFFFYQTTHWPYNLAIAMEAVQTLT